MEPFKGNPGAPPPGAKVFARFFQKALLSYPFK
jgi:hypothetical protein